jgi:hypothetical protein
MYVVSEAGITGSRRRFSVFWRHLATPRRSVAVRPADSDQRQIVVEGPIRGHARAPAPSSVLADRADPALVQGRLDHRGRKS